MSENVLDRIILKSSLSSLSNVVCIENLVKKNSMFVPSRLNPFKPDRTGKLSFDNSSIKYKKEIEPHQVKSINSMMEKTKSNLVDEIQKINNSHMKRILHSIPSSKISEAK